MYTVCGIDLEHSLAFYFYHFIDASRAVTLARLIKLLQMDLNRNMRIGEL